MAKPGIAPPESVVQTACPLDCPDACTLNVTVRGGRVMKIDGATENHITDGYICAKVRRFPERLYGDDRLLYPAIRRGTKGSGLFKRATWDDALDLIAEKMQSARANGGAETILPLCYGGSNGYLTQDYADAILFRRLGTSRLLRTVCAAPTGAANAGLEFFSRSAMGGSFFSGHSAAAQRVRRLPCHGGRPALAAHRGRGGP